MAVVAGPMLGITVQSLHGEVVWGPEPVGSDTTLQDFVLRVAQAIGHPASLLHLVSGVRELLQAGGSGAQTLEAAGVLDGAVLQVVRKPYPAVALYTSRHPGILCLQGPPSPGGQLATRSLGPGVSFFGEMLCARAGDDSGDAYRLWDPAHSRVAATVMGSLRNALVRPSSTALCLGVPPDLARTVLFLSEAVSADGRVHVVGPSLGCNRGLAAVSAGAPNVLLHEAATDAWEAACAAVGRVDALFATVAGEPQQLPAELAGGEPAAASPHAPIEAIARIAARALASRQSTAVVTVDSSGAGADRDAGLSRVVRYLSDRHFVPREMNSLHPFFPAHAVIIAHCCAAGM